MPILLVVYSFAQSTDHSKKPQAINEPIQPIPLENKLDQRKVTLGDQLFHDPQLSKDGTISCASCHSLSKGGTDNLPFSRGINGAIGNRNAPTVYNSGFNFKQFWDGRAETLEDQIDGPISHPKEMGSNWTDVIKILQKNRKYSSTFSKIYPDGITQKNIKDAIATFERSLTTPDSKFDQFLRGNKEILNEKEKQGYNLFKSYGCISCHQGVNVGGNMFQKFGMVEKHPERKDDLFKVPSLRNIALTYPYFHDGSAKTLEEAVKEMAKYQLGRSLDRKEIDLITAFLKTLTGKYKGISLDEFKNQ